MDIPRNQVKRCEVCGDDDLEFLNGEVTCRMCGTQCANLETQVVLDETIQFRYLTQIGGQSQAALESTIHEKPTIVLPWKLSEPFQLILFAQIRAIHSNLDLPKDYFSMVVQLWMRYLKATGEAFLTENERLRCKYPYGWGSMYNPEQGTENMRYAVKRRRLYNRKTAPNPQRQHDRLEAERSLREMDFGDGDDPLSSSSSDISDLSSVDDAPRRKRPRKAPEPKADARKYWRGWCGEQVGRWYLLEFNLAVCFVPLLFLRRHLGLADLLDLVRRQLVPFQNARTVLPASFVIRDKDLAQCFRRSRAVPSRSCMVRVTRTLMDLLGIQQLPRFPLLAHITGRAETLRLPTRVATLARRVAFRWLTDTRATRYVAGEAAFHRGPDCNAVCPDVVVMAFVLLVLFCLRGPDFTEAQRRQVSVLLLREATDREDLFLWNEWAPRLAKVRNLGKSVTSMEDASDFLDLPDVGLLIQEDLCNAQEADEEDEEKEEQAKRGTTAGRAIQAHEHPLLMQQDDFVRELMAPFETLIEEAVEREEKERGEASGVASDFKDHVLCCPVGPGTLAELLEDPVVASGSSSPALFSQDQSSEAENARPADIGHLLAGLPTEEGLGSDAVARLPEEPPADFREVVALCAQTIHAPTADLWMMTRNIQLSLMRISALWSNGSMAGLNQKASLLPLKWRSMFNPV